MDHTDETAVGGFDCPAEYWANTLQTGGRPGALSGVYVVRGLSLLSVVVFLRVILVILSV